MIQHPHSIEAVHYKMGLPMQLRSRSWHTAYLVRCTSRSSSMKLAMPLSSAHRGLPVHPVLGFYWTESICKHYPHVFYGTVTCRIEFL